MPTFGQLKIFGSCSFTRRRGYADDAAGLLEKEAEGIEAGLGGYLAECGRHLLLYHILEDPEGLHIEVPNRIALSIKSSHFDAGSSVIARCFPARRLCRLRMSRRKTK
jgi:hypothetical protein